MYVQSTNREHGDDHQALFHAHVQLDEFRNRHCKDDAVKSNVDDRMRPNKRVQVNTFARM